MPIGFGYAHNPQLFSCDAIRARYYWEVENRAVTLNSEHRYRYFRTRTAALAYAATLPAWGLRHWEKTSRYHMAWCLVGQSA
jgi:hypothetical protein